MNYTKPFDEISLADVALVGGKTASLGEMYHNLCAQGIRVPNGFAITAQAYRDVVQHNRIREPMLRLLESYATQPTVPQLQKTGSAIRELFVHAEFPEQITAEITRAYQLLSDYYKQPNLAVAVRSSATAEDLPEASFAGQQESYLNISGPNALLDACKNCMASLFTDRAIVYRQEKNIDHAAVALAIAVQKMVRSDRASAGVLFTIDTETGFSDVIIINGSYGLGEAVVKGVVNPDEYWVHKPTLEQGYTSIIKKRLGEKNYKVVYTNGGGTQQVATTAQEQNSFVLNDAEILELAKAALIIERHYARLYGVAKPMDVEWAKDGTDHQLYIVQARPETVHAIKKDDKQWATYSFKKQPPESAVVARGQAVGTHIVTGTARVIKTIGDLQTFNAGDILVTRLTDPDWVPLMKKAAAIITDCGGRTSHAAIVSRELGIPAVVGTSDATKNIADGSAVTVDCSQGSNGVVYAGTYRAEKVCIDLAKPTTVPVRVLLNIADPDAAMSLSKLPVDGVGLARIEFIIANSIKIHPMAAINYAKITDESVRRDIAACARAFPDPATFFVDTLACGIATIAAAFYPRSVLVRLSDFKSNEYRNLIGGSFFEPVEENPMLGLRGASRYYSDQYASAFALECRALKKVREQMGLTNVDIMIPFVRTVQEAEKVIALLASQGLKRAKNLALYMMCEIPSNVLLINEFSVLFDGISIGSNDLTQMTLAVDRDCHELAALFDERNAAVLAMMKLAVEGARRNGIKSGICGQAPSDYPEVFTFLVDAGIDSVSLNSDAVVTLFSCNGFGARK